MNMHWNQYWQQGHLTSFGDSYERNYTGVLQQVWLDPVESLPDNFRVLDIATGNGALPLMIREMECNAQRKGLIIGVDLAQVHQPSVSDDSVGIEINLKSNIDCCNMPFESNSFDLITSQYGIEYASLTAALPEALRVLRQGGRLQLIVHHDHSMIIEKNRRILNLISNCLTDELFVILRIMIEQMGEISCESDLNKLKQDVQSEANRIELNRLIGELVKLDEEALKDSELMVYISMLFKTGIFWSYKKKVRYLDFAEKEILTLKLRLKELVKAAVSQQVIAEIINNTSHFGCVEEVSVVREPEGNAILAWKIIIFKV
ncbi:class I SAM-dependent methyltransferase [Shewanella schlegeliana]|uniref:Class I SAM-dependent methyltransferase n=1 Tax=Shewanella schlegeliana TaxID=190308 RepID=A0ABS1SXD5_9GAMM|nr:class I SAM-dependent methyltransferase [Shewanella schlegeliana]MBL4913218.1 class I SAM-dependent methyltransferase [Shewanella schlegeliana]MCL1109173.1 class I SAM-dependent methyltransferase [Shewanella schlegeliana]GIU24213.1 hypothetical protein TUM4433_07600 [Shewanella schlegeliana]